MQNDLVREGWQMGGDVGELAAEDGGDGDGVDESKVSTTRGDDAKTMAHGVHDGRKLDVQSKLLGSSSNKRAGAAIEAVFLK